MEATGMIKITVCWQLEQWNWEWSVNLYRGSKLVDIISVHFATM